MGSAETLDHMLKRVVGDTRPPDPGLLAETMTAGVEALAGEPESTRPPDRLRRPGGLVRPDPELVTIVVPDVHARRGLIHALLSLELSPWGVDGTVTTALADGSAQIVFVGDYVHAEARAVNRWRTAFDEFQDGFRRREAMDAEMAESLGVLMLVATMKHAYPRTVHLLKGNHENIRNEYAGGNFPFRKFVLEGNMVAEYMERFYGGEPYAAVYQFEKNLPLLAEMPHFLVSHAEPQRPFDADEIIEFRERDDVVSGLTWTDNDAAEPGSVTRMLGSFLGPGAAENAYHFGGHRPIQGTYNLRANGRYVQLHNPDRYIAAILSAETHIDLDRDVIQLQSTVDVA